MTIAMRQAVVKQAKKNDPREGTKISKGVGAGGGTPTSGSTQGTDYR